jgi:hypothetical protein
LRREAAERRVCTDLEAKMTLEQQLTFSVAPMMDWSERAYLSKYYWWAFCAPLKREAMIQYNPVEITTICQTSCALESRRGFS